MKVHQVFTPAEREAVVAAYASWKGTQVPCAASLGSRIAQRESGCRVSEDTSERRP